MSYAERAETEFRKRQHELADARRLTNALQAELVELRRTDPQLL